jgi:hypothetical protein
LGRPGCRQILIDNPAEHDRSIAGGFLIAGG